MTNKQKRSAARASKHLIKQEFITGSPEETKLIGKLFAKKLIKGDVIALKGGLGSGKTTFVQGILDSYGIRKFARSASFVLVNEYGLKNRTLTHMDLYRLDGRAINRLGIEEYLSSGGITVIEWADKIKRGVLYPAYDVRFKWLGGQKRKITIFAGEKTR
jgi:tRNA threonylcarbamoyladenosine biosynthesis protein TsaE